MKYQVRDIDGVVVGSGGVKGRPEDLPPVEVARPSHCRACGVASQPVGESLRLHGHGLRERQAWGFVPWESEPGLHEVWLRRYQCQDCGAVMTVGPPWLVGRHRYTLATIVVALWLWALQGRPEAEVRDTVRPFRHSGVGCAGRWSRLRRWARGLPWPSDVMDDAQQTARQMAERRVQAVLSFCQGSVASAGSLRACIERLGRWRAP